MDICQSVSGQRRSWSGLASLLSVSLLSFSLLSFCRFSLKTVILYTDGDFSSRRRLSGFSLSVGCSRFLSAATSLSVSLSTLSLVSLSRRRLLFLSVHLWFVSLFLGVSSLDGDGTPSRCLSSKVKRVLCCSIMHVFRLCMFLFWSILHVFLFVCLVDSVSRWLSSTTATENYLGGSPPM